jgi:hypothetical protein
MFLILNAHVSLYQNGIFSWDFQMQVSKLSSYEFQIFESL